MIRTQIQLTEEQARKLKNLSRSRHISTAELVRQAVDKLTLDESKDEAEGKITRARAAAGKYSSGKSDVSSLHDDYFADTVLP